MSKICKNCQTVNEDKFSYCKNCGTPLEIAEKTYASNPYKQYAYSNPIPNEIDGIPTEEVQNFIGNNKQKIIDKFAKMSITGSKISWCWPAAILSLFFGFFGAAFWLFYRKMYKHGSIALAIGLVVLGFNTAITYTPTIEFFEILMNTIFSLRSGSPNFSEINAVIQEALTNFTATKPIMLSNFINETATYCSTVIYGMFGMYLYKKHAVIKISGYRSVNLQSEYYGYGIKAIGGTSAGMMVLAVILTIVLQNIISSIPLLIHILF